jgi:hypothetical protein
MNNNTSANNQPQKEGQANSTSKDNSGVGQGTDEIIRVPTRSIAIEEFYELDNRSSRISSFQRNSSLSQARMNSSSLHPAENGLVLINANISNNKLEGTGRLNSEDYVYYGQWYDSRFNGYGRITKRNFALYEGQFSDNRRDGYGVEIYVNSDIYIGEFKADKKNGLGIYLFSNGGYYYGFFDKNFREGFGTLYNKANRQTYTGFWSKDMRHGRGIEFYKNGSKYDGFFDNDKRQGVGFMEYSKSLLYIGEWVAGKRDGLGKVEHNKKTVSGKFKADQFVEPIPFNSTTHADLLLNHSLPRNVEEHLGQINYKLKKNLIRGIGDLYSVLKESLVCYVLSLAESSILRLSSYLRLKNIFSKSSRFEFVMDDILLALKYEPNPENLSVYWDPALREIVVNKHDFSWQKWDLDVNTNKLVFDETQVGNDTPDIQFKRNEETIQLTITNEIAIVKTDALDGEGVLNNEGFQLRYFKANTSEWENTASVKIYPFFLTHEDYAKKSVFSLKLSHYVGEFYFGKDNSQPKELSLFLAVDQEGTWYSVGADTVGSYVICGNWNKTTSSGHLLQKYFLEYQIEYDLFLATDDKLQGLWKTTNMGGHFVLRKDTSFRFSTEVARVLHEIIEREKSGERVEFNDLEVLKPYTEASILSVIVKRDQEGIPDFIDENQDEGDRDLFERYKKLQENDASALAGPQRKSTVTNPGFRRESEVNSKVLKIEAIEEDLELTRKARASLAFMNLQAVDKLATQELQEIDAKQNGLTSNNFQKNLSNALRGLKQTVSDSIRRAHYKFDQNSENVNWVGTFVTLGKEEQIIFDNLYIIGDMIEGIFTDADGVSYELAGSYSLKSKEFEIVGMSFDKTKSVKIRGELANFKLRGVMSRQPASGPSSNVEIKLIGYESKALIKFYSNGVSFENLDATFKLTSAYLYGMIAFEKDIIFLNGVNEKEIGYGLEINTSNKQFKNNVLIQAKSEYNAKDKSSAYDRKLVFWNDDVEIVLFY